MVPFRACHVDLLASWLKEPHVAQWYQPVAKHLNAAINPPGATTQVLIQCGPSLVGYLRWQVAARGSAIGNEVAIDLMIGSPSHLGMGIGPKALCLLAHRFSADHRIGAMVAWPDMRNSAARRAFEKAGFAAVVHGGQRDVCLMVRDLHHERRVDLALLVGSDPEATPVTL